MKERLEMLLKTEQLSRIVLDDEELTIDLHEMGKAECCWLIRTIIAATRTGFRMNLIHGYNRGQALKKVLRTEKMSCRVTDVYSDPWNPGITHMNVAGLI